MSDLSHYHFMSWIYLIYRYFLSIYMPAADQFGRTPCIGAMGLLRRSALETVGGWNGDYLTEDMELTYRLFRQGFVPCFIDYSYGHSMPPAPSESDSAAQRAHAGALGHWTCGPAGPRA